jgi:hypothetical protein
MALFDGGLKYMCNNTLGAALRLFRERRSLER